MSTIPRFTRNRDVARIQGYQYGKKFFLLEGNDYLSVHADASTIDAGSGNDSVSLTGAYNRIDLGSGNDYFQLYAGNDNYIDLGTGNDSSDINGSNNTILDGFGNDSIRITGSGNTVFGGYDQDNVTIRGNNNTVDWFQSITHNNSGRKSLNISGNNNFIMAMDSNINISYNKQQNSPDSRQRNVIRGRDNTINVETAYMPSDKSMSLSLFNNELAITNLKVNMQEGSIFSVEARNLVTTIDLRFGSAGSDNVFRGFYFDVQTYSHSITRLNIITNNSQHVLIDRGWVNGSPLYTLEGPRGTANLPWGSITTSQVNGPLSIFLNGQRMIDWNGGV